MEYLAEEKQGFLLVRIFGSLKTMDALDFEDKLLEFIDKNSKVIVDMSQVEYISSAGLRTFLTAQQKVDQLPDKELIVMNPSHVVMSLFQSTGFINVLTIRY